MLGALLLAGACGGCGSGGPSGGRGRRESRSPTRPRRRRSQTDVRDARRWKRWSSVGHSVYEESASGRIVAEAVYRLASSRALAEAVAHDDAAATRRVLRSLLLNQIVSVRVTRERAHAGTDRAGSVGIAPASGRLLLDGRAGRDVHGVGAGRQRLRADDVGADGDAGAGAQRRARAEEHAAAGAARAGQGPAERELRRGELPRGHVRGRGVPGSADEHLAAGAVLLDRDDLREQRRDAQPTRRERGRTPGGWSPNGSTTRSTRAAKRN